MIERVMKKTLLPSVIFILSIVMVGKSALAGQHAKNNPTKPVLLIKEVIVDFDGIAGDTLTIKGVNFDKGATPTVTLGEDPSPLNLVRYSAYEILVDCPTTACSDGNYLLAVTTGPALKDYDKYDLTIGAVGLQGKQGLKGDTGEQGAKGHGGEKGETGETGPQGPIKGVERHATKQMERVTCYEEYECVCPDRSVPISAGVACRDKKSTIVRASTIKDGMGSWVGWRAECRNTRGKYQYPEQISVICIMTE